MDTNEIVWKTAVEQAALLRSGEVSSSEITQAHLDHIDRVNPGLNAIVTVVADHAMAMARDAYDAHARGDELGVLHGLPIAHKDLAETAGIRTTMGSVPFADNVPTQNALVVERAIQAGAVTVGKTNTPEFGAGSQTFNEVFGATKNPYDETKTCGGSSGGATVAVASAMVPLADGSDMGGSLRNPAAFCNVVGFRPSPGRVPAWPTANPWGHLATEGPIARTVDDVALLLAAQAGPDPRNPIALETPGSAFLPPVHEPMVPLRVAWAPDLGGLPIAPEVTEALAGVPAVFEELGHEVEAACPDLTEAGGVFDALRGWAFSNKLGHLMETRGDEFKETLRWNVLRGYEIPVTDNIAAWRKRAELFARTAEFFETYDFLLCPVTQVAPFDVETEYITEINGITMSTYIDWMRVCTDVTIMNCPAISVPGGFTHDGLPIGLQIVGPPRADAAVLSVAKQFESVTRVGDRRPELP